MAASSFFSLMASASKFCHRTKQAETPAWCRTVICASSNTTLCGNNPIMRVLVVEDEKKTASFIRKALQAESFAVDVCHCGNDALAAVETAPFEVVVLDIMLP